MKKNLDKYVWYTILALMLIGFTVACCSTNFGQMNITGFILTALAFYLIGIAVGRNWDEFTKE